MKKLLIILAICIPAIVWGQGTIIRTAPVSPTQSAPNYNKQTVQDANLSALLTFSIPVVTTPTFNNATPRVGALVYATQDSSIYVWSGHNWLKNGQGGGSGDTISFTTNFKNNGTVTNAIIDLADTIKKNNWCFKSTSTTLPVLTLDGSNTSGSNATIAVFKFMGVGEASIASNGIYYGLGIAANAGSANSYIFPRTHGALISHSIANGDTTLRVISVLSEQTGPIFTVDDYVSTMFKVAHDGKVSIRNAPLATSPDSAYVKNSDGSIGLAAYGSGSGTNLGNSDLTQSDPTRTFTVGDNLLQFVGSNASKYFNYSIGNSFWEFTADDITNNKSTDFQQNESTINETLIDHATNNRKSLAFNFVNPGIVITNDIDSTWMLYSGDYSPNSLSNQRAIPDVGGVTKLIDSLGTSGNTIYTGDGTLTGDRTVDQTGRSLTFAMDSLSSFNISGNQGEYTYNETHEFDFFQLFQSDSFTANFSAITSSGTGITFETSKSSGLEQSMIDMELDSAITIQDDYKSLGMKSFKDYSANIVKNDSAYTTTKAVRLLIDSLGGGSGITALTGDGTATGPGSAALTLATVNSNVGSFGDATHVATVTVNGKGLVTAASSTAITFPVTASNTVTFTNKSGNISQWTNDSGYITSAPTGANPAASISFTPVNGSATTYTRSDGAPKADSTIIRSVANSYSLSGMQTKLNDYILGTDSAAQSPYKGKTLYVIGDSFANDNIFQGSLTDRLGFTITTDGIPGSTITGGSGHHSFTSRIAAAVSAGKSMILIQGGSNDPYYGTTIGSYYSTDTTTLCGSLNYIFQAAAAAAIPVRLLIPTFRDDGLASGTSGLANWAFMVPYVEAMKAVAAQYGIQVIDEFYGSGINHYNASVFTTDGVHPNNTAGRFLYNNYLISNFNNNPNNASYSYIINAVNSLTVGSITPGAYPFNTVYPFAKTDVTERNVATFVSNEAPGSNAGMDITATGASTQAGRSVFLQTIDHSGTYGGNLWLQNHGGDTHIGHDAYIGGNLRVSSISTNGILKTSSGTGLFGVATPGTDYQAPISLTTTGSGAATFIANVLNIPTGSSLPITTTGDMIYSSSGSTAARLAIGGTNSFLTVVAGIPAWSAGALSVASGKTFTVNNTITLAGTDAQTYTFPTTSATIARTDAANTFTGHQTIEGVTATGATGTANMVYSASPTFTGNTTFGTFTTTAGNTNLSQGSSTGVGQPVGTQYQFAGSTAAFIRSAVGGGTTSTSITAGQPYANQAISSGTFTVGTGVTAPWAVQQEINSFGTITLTGSGAVTNTAMLRVENAATAGTNNYSAWFGTGLYHFDGLTASTGVVTDANKNLISEPAGQTTLVAGAKAISITGLTTSSKAYVSFVSIGGTVSTTWEYAGVCTSGTLTITALTNAGTTNTTDTSIVNYRVIP